MKTENEQTGPAAGDEFLTKEEVAKRLRVTTRTVERWQHDGFLPAVKRGNFLRFHWPSVVRVLTNTKTK